MATVSWYEPLAAATSGRRVPLVSSPQRQRTLLAWVEKAAKPSPLTVMLVPPLSVPPVGVSEEMLVGCT